MKLNLHILKEELKNWNLKGNLSDPPWERHCAYPQLCCELPNVFRREILYILKADILLDKIQAEGCPSVLCIGHPPEAWMRGGYNLLYTEEDVSVEKLLNEVNFQFYRYQKWIDSLQEVLDDQLPLQELGIRSGDFLTNPMDVTGAFFYVLCAYMPLYVSEHYKENYFVSAGHFWDADTANMLISDPEYNEAIHAVDPTVYSGAPFGYRTLFYNIMIDGLYVARICFEEIVEPFTERDFALIRILGDYFRKGLVNGRIYPFSYSAQMREVLQELLSHRMVPEQNVLSFLETCQWKVSDAYVCLVLELKTEDTTAALDTLAMRLSQMLTSECYILKDEAIVFICNLSQFKISRDKLYTTILPFLRDNLLSAGISTVYHDFKDLYYYYRQAMIAKEIGEKKNPTHWYFKFEEYQLDYMVRKCTEELIPDVLIPEGLRNLIEYDRNRNHDYTETLRIYLEHDRNIAETIRAAYMHRNTFVYRIGKIQEILKMDLADLDNRLLLLMAFRILDKAEPSVSLLREKGKDGQE